jgi:hypothetical protein
MRITLVTPWVCAAVLLALSSPVLLSAYPIDGYERTGIGRLEAARRIEAGELQAAKQPAGALLPTEQVDLRLRGAGVAELPPVDAEFTARIVALLGEYADRYSISVLDLSDRAHPRYAEHHGDVLRNPGSVGKLMVALAIFQVLADLYPDDLDARWRILRDTVVTADDVIISDSHSVRIWDRPTEQLIRRPLRVGDKGTLFEYLDWMLSASSNAAAAALMKEAVLLKHFGTRYPVEDAEAARFLKETPKGELQKVLAEVTHTPLTRNGLDVNRLRQGSLFTRVGKTMIPGTTSYATTRELLKYLLKMEHGELVDEFSSREIKRLLYMTERRIRYASSPALRDAAVYFKSGSLFRCQPEEGFRCVQYQGNKENLMNSVAIVEHPAGHPELYYLVTLTSNVLKRNSAVDHQTFATRLQELIRSYHAGPAPERSDP